MITRLITLPSGILENKKLYVLFSFIFFFEGFLIKNIYGLYTQIEQLSIQLEVERAKILELSTQIEALRYRLDSQISQSKGFLTAISDNLANPWVFGTLLLLGILVLIYIDYLPPSSGLPSIAPEKVEVMDVIPNVVEDIVAIAVPSVQVLASGNYSLPQIFPNLLLFTGNDVLPPLFQFVSYATYIMVVSPRLFCNVGCIFYSAFSIRFPSFGSSTNLFITHDNRVDFLRVFDRMCMGSLDLPLFSDYTIDEVVDILSEDQFRTVFYMLIVRLGVGMVVDDDELDLF